MSTTAATSTVPRAAVLPPPLAPECPDGGIPAGAIPRTRAEHALTLKSLSIVLPCLNEEASVADAIRNAASAAARTSEEYEIIVVDDGSTDDTASVAARFVDAGDRVRLLVHTHNRGYGDAVRTGIAAARMDWVLLTDADLQFDLRELEELVHLTASADVLWGWRILRQDTAARRAAAAAWNRLVRGLFRLPVRDIDCGFKLIRRDVLQRFELRTGGAMISTELAVRSRAANARIVEVGVHHRPRVTGEETGGSPRVILRAFLELAAMYGALRRLSNGKG